MRLRLFSGCVPAVAGVAPTQHAACAFARRGLLVLALACGFGPNQLQAQGGDGVAAAEAALTTRDGVIRLSALIGLQKIPIAVSLTDAQVSDFERANISDTVHKALANSRTLGASKARVRSSQAMTDVARGEFRPSIDLRFTHGREISRPGSVVNELTGEPVVESSHSRGDETSILRQTLFDRSASKELARQEALYGASRQTMLKTRHDVAAEAIGAHLETLRFRVATEFAREQEFALGQLAEYVAARAEAGGASPADAERITARAINANARVIESRGAFESALIAYRRIVGAAPQWMTTDDRVSSTPLPAIDAAIKQAMLTNPGLNSRRENLRSLQLEASASRATRLPTVHFELGNYRTTNAGGQPGTSNDTRALLVMSLNLLNGGKDHARERSALARAEEAGLLLKDAEERLRESITVSYNTLDAVEQRAQSTRKEYQANQRVARAFRGQLDTASRPLLDVLDAQERLFASRLELLRLVVLQATTQVQIHGLIGADWLDAGTMPTGGQ